MPETDSPFTVLFICTGNIARSAFAEAILKKRLEDENVEDITVDSAGVMRLSGMPASQSMELVAQSLGVDLSPHRSRHADAWRLQNADIILVMTDEHLSYVQSISPDLQEKTFLLKAYGRDDATTMQEIEPSLNIDDPIGGELETFQAIGDQIAGEIDRIVPLLLTQRNKHSH